MRYLMVGIGGFFGALARYGVSLVLNNTMFPWGTITANLLGCLLLALFLTVILYRFDGSSYIVLAVSTGFIGSFTTLSTLSVEGITLLQTNVNLALLYLGITLTGGAIFTWVGYLAANYILQN